MRKFNDLMSAANNSKGNLKIYMLKIVLLEVYSMHFKVVNYQNKKSNI